VNCSPIRQYQKHGVQSPDVKWAVTANWVVASPEFAKLEREQMGPLVDRTEFRTVLKEVVKCVRQNLDAPGLSALTPEQLLSWFQNITLEDIRIVVRQIENDSPPRS
jgi:hypothetical protein